MSGLEFYLDITGLESAAARILSLGSIKKQEVLLSLAQLGAGQTQARIESEKRSPEDDPWEPSGAQRKPGQSLLFMEGNLAQSLMGDVSGDEATWGSNLVYAAIHQFGGVIEPKNAKKLVFEMGGQTVFADSVSIPARPYLGISDDNASELEELALEMVAGELND